MRHWRNGSVVVFQTSGESPILSCRTAYRRSLMVEHLKQSFHFLSATLQNVREDYIAFGAGCGGSIPSVDTFSERRTMRSNDRKVSDWKKSCEEQWAKDKELTSL